jgi:hypothetical protein
MKFYRILDKISGKFLGAGGKDSDKEGKVWNQRTIKLAINNMSGWYGKYSDKHFLRDCELIEYDLVETGMRMNPIEFYMDSKKKKTK